MFEEGVYTVLVTPFNEDGNISYSCLDELVLRQMNKGVQGIITIGTTSESPTISLEEKKNMIKYIWNKYNGQIDIIIGIGGNNTKEVINFGQYCADYSDGLMVTVPYYNKPSQNGIFEHFFQIANANKINTKPIMLYNIPSRCGVNMNPDTIINLVNICNNIVAIKEASGSIDQALQIKLGCNIKIFSGDDALLLPLMSIGAVGVISVASNLLPEYFVNMVNLCNNNNFDEARYKYSKVHNLIKALFIDTNPVPLKYLLEKINVIKNSTVRLPLVSIDNEEHLIILNEQIDVINNIMCNINEQMLNNGI